MRNNEALDMIFQTDMTSYEWAHPSLYDNRAKDTKRKKYYTFLVCFLQLKLIFAIVAWCTLREFTISIFNDSLSKSYSPLEQFCHYALHPCPFVNIYEHVIKGQVVALWDPELLVVSKTKLDCPHKPRREWNILSAVCFETDAMPSLNTQSCIRGLLVVRDFCFWAI